MNRTGSSGPKPRPRLQVYSCMAKLHRFAMNCSAAVEKGHWEGGHDDTIATESRMEKGAEKNTTSSALGGQNATVFRTRYSFT